VLQLPNRSGRSRHGLPVRAIHSTASRNSRLSLPLRPGSVGLPRQCGSILANGRRSAISIHSQRESHPQRKVNLEGSVRSRRGERRPWRHGGQDFGRPQSDAHAALHRRASLRDDKTHFWRGRFLTRGLRRVKPKPSSRYWPTTSSTPPISPDQRHFRDKAFPRPKHGRQRFMGGGQLPVSFGEARLRSPPTYRWNAYEGRDTKWEVQRNLPHLHRRVAGT
jgi:hypothetical protein